MKKRYLVALISLLLFIIITILVITNNMTTFDNYFYNLIHGFSNKYLDIFFTKFTHIGDTLPVIIIGIIIVTFLKEKSNRIKLTGSILLTVGFNQLLKHIILRDRPPLERRLIKQGGYSYPSGHSMVSLCIYGFLIYLVMTRIKDKKIKIILTVLLTLMILLICISRIYVGVHYPSDVLGGFLLSLAILIGVISFVDYHFKGE